MDSYGDFILKDDGNDAGEWSGPYFKGQTSSNEQGEQEFEIYYYLDFMEVIKNQIKLCECGCGEPAPLAPRNWHSKGIKKGNPLRFVCGHHRRNKEQSEAEKLKRVAKWGVTDAAISPYLPGNKIIRFLPVQKRWYCSAGKNSPTGKFNSKRPHARMVYEHNHGPIPEGFVVHHKSGRADRIEDDRPENLMLVSPLWNLHFFPRLAQGFGVPESVVTDAYVAVVDKYPQHLVFTEICKKLIELKERSEHA